MCWQRLSTLGLGATLATAATAAVNVVELSGNDWILSSQSLNISVPGHLPSQVHLDLYQAQVIEDPYFGLNDFNLRWVADSNWTYTTTPRSLSQTSASTWLLFNGLDTYTDIQVCDKHVASTSNQFRQYHFDVTSLIKGCTNPVLSINFGSAAKISAAIAAQPGQETWPFGVEGLFEYPNRQFVRKEQSDFGWDWGPAFMPAGPWQPAYVIQLDSTAVYSRNALVDIYLQGQQNLYPPDQSQPWVLNASIDVIGTLPVGASLTYTLIDGTNKTIASGSLDNVRQGGNVITGNTVIPANLVDLWWPTGLGPQVLYTLKLQILSGSVVLENVSRRVGFRTIVLNELPVSATQIAQGIAPGNNWHFEINGHEFYAKGSNMIPPDVFWPRVDEERIRQLFTAVVAGNQNMLRVWSSGAYSPDFMYDLADEMGILLWSEFEFGDALYPVDKDFLDNVREEATYQIRRVNHHPSLALWAGGNELENLELPMVNNTAPDLFPKYLAEYEKLFIDTLAPIVFGNSRSISYTPSSTTTGWLSLNLSSSHPMIERYANKTPGSIYGDTDYYNYNSAQAFNFSSYPVGRFSNEFGYHSMPSLQSWRAVLAPEDLHFNSSTIILRNHHYPAGGLSTDNYTNSSKGMAEMTIAVQRYYPVPLKTDPIANFSAWCHATQIFQADFYKSQIEFYRRGSGMPERQMGSLYWQLNDIWQAPTWAGIEYDGRWKVLHYVAKDVYSNVIISPFHDEERDLLEVWVTSDLWTSATGTARLVFSDWAGNQLDIDSVPISTEFTVGAINTTRMFSGPLSTILKGQDPTNIVLSLSTYVNGSLPNSNATQTFEHTNIWTPVPLNQAQLVDPGLVLTHNESAQTFTVKATTGVAAWIWLDYPAGATVFFDDNGFWLAKGQSKTVGYTVQKDNTESTWIEGVTVESIWNQTLSD